MIGSAPPAFRLPASDGKTYALEELKGKNVVLVFYPMNDTPG